MSIFSLSAVEAPSAVRLMPCRGDFNWLTGPIMSREAGSRALDATAARSVLRPVRAANPVRVDRAFRKLGRIDVSTARYAMDVGRIFLGSRRTLKTLPLAFGKSLFSFHRVVP